MAQRKSKGKKVNKKEIIDTNIRTTMTLMVIVPMSIIFIMVAMAWTVVAISSGSIPDTAVLESIFKHAFDFVFLFLGNNAN